MLEKPQIVQSPARQSAIIRLTVPRAEIQNVMGPGLSEILAALVKQGIAPAGPWFNHHLRMVPNIFGFEISVPVPSPIKAVGRVKPGELPA